MADAALHEDPTAGPYNGLTRPERTLESSWYFDPAHYRRELGAIWGRNWIYLCRAQSLAGPLAYRTFRIGDQPILLLRDEAGEMRAFFNTCRHRGSILCTEPEGKLRSKGITCPYHAWTYRLDGSLARIPSVHDNNYLQPKELSLYPIALKTWRGFVYVNLSDGSRPLNDHFNAPGDDFGHWPLEDLVVGRRLTKRLNCNWKVFWENYNECLHCPGVHPALTRLVPIYKRGIMEKRDDPKWPEYEASEDPSHLGGLRPGAGSWSTDGQLVGKEFPQLTDQERRLGYQFMTSIPSHYLVLHADHVRSSRLLPLGPETMEIELEWLFSRETLEDSSADIGRACDFSAQVIAEDGAACERTQLGLHSAPHGRGYLMPEEYDVFRFQQWVREQLL